MNDEINIKQKELINKIKKLNDEEINQLFNSCLKEFDLSDLT